MFITDISLKRPTFAIVVIIALLTLGIVSFMGLNLNDQPESNLPYVSVSIILPSASPDQVESKVTKVVEDNLGQLSGVKHLTSMVSEGYSMTVIEFDDSRSVDDAAQDVRTKLSSISSQLPSDMKDPVISKININDSPVLSLAVSSNLSAVELSNLVDNTIVPNINTVNGVGSVNTYGLLEREIQIKVDKDKLSALNLNINQVLNGLSSDNIDAPSGKVSNNDREVTLRAYSSMKSVKEFKNVIIATINGTEIRLGDVATVIDGYKDNDSVSYYNGKACIGIDITKQSGTNTVKVTDAVKKQLETLQASLPSDTKIDIVDDNSTTIRASVKSVEETMVEGCALAVLIIFLFLRTFGSTLVSAISLPTSIITTFAAMKMMGFSLNIMSLMGLSLSVGLLVDDSIVVIENIVRHLRMGKNPIQAAKEATSEISLAVLATTLTIVAIFLPMSTMDGILGPFFKEFGLTIAVAVLISLFISFTLVPLLSSKYVKDEEMLEPRTKVGRFLHWFNEQFDLLAKGYEKILPIVLRNRKKTILITAALLIASIALIPAMGISFTPSQDKGTITIDADLDSGLSLKAAESKAKAIEKIVKKYPDTQEIYTTVKADNVHLKVTLNDKKERKLSSTEIADQMRTEIKKIPGLDLSVSGASSMSSNAAKSYAIHVQGEDFEQVLEYSQKAKQILAQMPGAVDVGISYKAGKPETKLVVDRDAAADLGVAPATIANVLRVMYSGSTVGQYDSNGDRIDVNVSVEDNQSQNIDNISGIYLPSSTSGKMIPIEQLVKKEYGTQSAQIDRYDKSRDVQIQANFVNTTSSELNKAFMKALDKELPMPQGVHFVLGSDQQFMQESMGGLVQAFILGILFIFLILAAQFESWLDPLAIMFALPLAIIGAILGLFLSGDGISMVGLIGIFFLMGLVTKNAILLVDFIKKRREEGLDRKEAIIEAGLTRLRPIMMTSLAMIFGMLPSALNSGTGSEMWQPMAVAIIGGLISSTLLTLLFIPVIYTILDDLKVKLMKAKSKAGVNISNKIKRVS